MAIPQGGLANAKGLSRRVQRGIAELDSELQLPLTKAEEWMNAPGR